MFVPNNKNKQVCVCVSCLQFRVISFHRCYCVSKNHTNSSNVAFCGPEADCTDKGMTNVSDNTAIPGKKNGLEGIDYLASWKL